MLTLIIGGARSGKSDLAQRLAAGSNRDVLFVATAEARDDEMRARIARHRSSRPENWSTLEEPVDVVNVLRAQTRPDACVVLDCVTLWISNILELELAAAEGTRAEHGDAAIDRAIGRARALLDWYDTFGGELIVVSNETGMGVVPMTALGRAFRDALGAVNRLIAGRADRVYHLVAGLGIELKAHGARPVEDIGQEPG
jgi:adenosyl cobinamide kinase/adenosyl cobinamide phosphate guanylyltransferase